MKRHRTDHLDIEVPLAQYPLGCLADGRKRLDGQIVERFAVLETLAEFDGASRQLVVGEADDLGFGRVDLGDDLLEFLEGAAFTGLENLGKESTYRGANAYRRGRRSR